MASEVKLRHCPFCGGEAKMIASRPGIEDRVWHVARCADNFCIGGSINIWQTTPERAATVWNRRANCGNAAAMREALVKIREKCVIYNNDLAEEIDALCGNALAAPPRNVDKCESLEQARKAWFAEEIQPRIDDIPMDHNEIPFETWLFAPAAEKGAEDGSK